MSNGPTRKGVVFFILNSWLALLMAWLAFFVETRPGFEWAFSPCALTGLFALCVGFVMLLFSEEVNE